MSTFYPSIYDNAYKYNTLQNNSIVITTQTGFADVAAANNTVLVCNADGQWVTSSLDNFATSTDITNIQNSINNLSTYDDILQQSISNNITAINTLQTNLTNNYFTKTEITDNLSNYVDISTFDEYNIMLADVLTPMSNEISILTEDIIHMQDTFSNLDQYAFITLGSDMYLEGTWKLYGTVTLYISDITKMTPTVNTLTKAEWVAALPVFEIRIDFMQLREDITDILVFQEKIESNRPLITIPINAIITISSDESDELYKIYTDIDLPSRSNIKIDYDDIRLYKYNLYLERINNREIVEKVYNGEDYPYE